VSGTRLGVPAPTVSVVWSLEFTVITCDITDTWIQPQPETQTQTQTQRERKREREDMMEEACAGTCAHHSAGLRAKKVVHDQVAIGVERSQRLRSHSTGLCGARATACAAAGGSRGEERACRDKRPAGTPCMNTCAHAGGADLRDFLLKLFANDCIRGGAPGLLCCSFGLLLLPGILHGLPAGFPLWRSLPRRPTVLRTKGQTNKQTLAGAGVGQISGIGQKKKRCTAQTNWANKPAAHRGAARHSLFAELQTNKPWPAPGGRACSAWAARSPPPGPYDPCMGARVAPPAPGRRSRSPTAAALRRWERISYSRALRSAVSEVVFCRSQNFCYNAPLKRSNFCI
jgi:hypothetical protein